MSPVLPSIGTSMGPGWGSYLAHAPFEDHAFGEVLSEQVRFRTVRPGATSADDVRPDSVAAAKLWEQPTTKRFVQGVLDLANGMAVDGTAELGGFSLSTSEAGYVANRAVHSFGAGSPTDDAFAAGVQQARTHTTNTAAVRKGDWLHLDPQRSAGLLHMLERPDDTLADLDARTRESLGRGVKTLLHELNHVASPRPPSATNMDWLSEGTAETLARWPGRVTQAAKVLGVPVPAKAGSWFDDEGRPYQEEVDSVRGLLRLSGIDPTKAHDFARAERLLNRTPEDRLARTIASHIVRAQPVEDAARGALRSRISEIVSSRIARDGSNADPGVVHDLANLFTPADHA
ncbi:MAG: hypothetical protein JWM98_479 [Thermoleophilia bacterium]|nr:hypothetical protein [Thermoleophilia bacterium]